MVRKGMIPAVLAGAIAAAVVMGGCEKKSEETKQAAPAETAAKPAEAPAAAETKPAEAPPPAETKPTEAPPAPAEAKPAEAPPAAESKPAEQPAPVKTAEASTEAQTPFDPEHPYKRYSDGKWDFRVYRGYNMYHSICHVCHGPNANGSSFAPALKESLQTLTYEDFVSTVMNGRVNITPGTTNVMPSFGENPSVVKYIDSLYAYIKARSTGALGTEEVQWEGPKYNP